MKSGDNSKPKTKRQVFEDWMEGDHVLVQLDARHEDVSVPSHLADNAALTLKLSYRFQGSTTVDEKGVVSYLRFAGDYCECIIPWDAIWGMTSADNLTEVWTEDVPKEVLLQIACSKISDFGKKLFKKDGEVPSEPNARSPLSAVTKDSPTEEAEPQAKVEPARPLAVISEASAPSSSEADSKGEESPEEKKVLRKKPNLKLVK